MLMEIMEKIISELLECDEDDESMEAAAEKNLAEQIEHMPAAAEQITKFGR